MQPGRSRRNTLLVVATLAAAAAAIVTTLMVPPIVGLADNGDFDRVMNPAGLRSLAPNFETRYFQWMQPRFAFAAAVEDPSAYRTSELFLARGAVRVAKLFRGELFDIRYLGAIHAVLLLLAFGLFVAAASDLSTGAQIAGAALLVFFFTDSVYLASFQSLYSQPASLSFFLLTAAVAALGIRRGRLSTAELFAYFLCAALFVTSKPQESIQAILIAPLGVRLAWPSSGRAARAASVVLAVALVGLAWRYYRSADNALGWLTRYNVLFFEILPHSPDPAKDLAELGLDPSLARYARVNAWGPDSPSRIPEVRSFLQRRSGQPSPRSLYLRHPERVLGPIGRAATVAFHSPRELGTYARESGAPPLARAQGAWGRLRERLPGAPALILLLGGTLAAAAATYRGATPRGRLAREALVILVAMGAGGFVVAALGDWQVDIERHLYTVQAVCDLILVADVVWIFQALASRRRASQRLAPIDFRTDGGTPHR
jgi:hypothetical protein